MRRLLPDVADDPLESVYDDVELPGGDDRAAVSLGMVASADGAATLHGTTAELGGDADRAAFRALRDACDAILVGAGTVRAEDYGPAAGSPRRRHRRVARGLAPAPRLVVVTGSLDLDPAARLFSDPDHPPLVLTHGRAPADRAAALEPVADVVRVGDDAVDLSAALVHLAGLGLRRVLCEGGPHLNGALLAADLVDELFLTVAPVAVGGRGQRIVTGVREPVRPLTLVELREHDGELLLRYRRRR